MSLYTDDLVENTVIFGTNAIVLDIGGNFKNVCERLNGEYGMQPVNV